MTEEKKRTRTRINSKIGQLPENIQDSIDEMLKDTSITYEAIALWLTDAGYEVSKSAVGRYAVRANKAAMRVTEHLQKTRVIMKEIEKNPDTDYTKASRALMLSGLQERIATAEDEWGEMSLENVGKLLTQMARVELAEQRLKKDYKTKIDLAFEGLEGELMSFIKSDKDLATQLKDVLAKAKEKMVSDD